MIAPTVAAITGRRIHRAKLGHLARSLILLTTLTLPAHAQLDTRENGMSDVWERHFNRDNPGQLFDPENPTHQPDCDPDGDGWTNLEESIAGTDPFSANPPEGMVAVHITYLHDVEINNPPEPSRISDVAMITWDTLPGKHYTVWMSPDLSPGSWVLVAGPFHGDGDPEGVPVELTDAYGETEPRNFWRVKVADPHIDSDNDGLTDYEEYLLRSNPINPDTSGDGIPDGWLAAHGLSPAHHHGGIDFLGFSGITIPAAFAMGVQAHPNATPDDLDGDGVENHLDAMPWEPYANWPAAPGFSNAIIPLGAPQGYLGGVTGIVGGGGGIDVSVVGLHSPAFGVTALGADGSILLTENRSTQITTPAEAPDAMRTWLIRPGGTWESIAWPANAAARGIGLGPDGQILGAGLIPLVDANGDPAIFPGTAARTWLHNGTSTSVIHDALSVIDGNNEATNFAAGTNFT